MKTVIAMLCTALCVLLCSCTHVGEKDSLDFFDAMDKKGYALAAEEISSGEQLREGCYINGCKISLFSTREGKLCRVSITYAGAGDYSAFAPVALESIQAMCGYSAGQAQGVMNTLGVGSELPASTHGVCVCSDEWFMFSFTCDEAGGLLVVDSLRFNPTAAPTVTVRETIPLPEKAETRP